MCWIRAISFVSDCFCVTLLASIEGLGPLLVFYNDAARCGRGALPGDGVFVCGFCRPFHGFWLQSCISGTLAAVYSVLVISSRA
jgi:hypothetical protein